MANSSAPETPMADAERAMAAIENVVRTLGPLTSPERQKVVQAALVILGEAPISKSHASSSEDSAALGEAGDLPARARLWMKQNSLTIDDLQHVFDIADGKVAVIASEISGKSNAEKTAKAYLLSGLVGLLTSGEPTFADKTARSLCEALGCYDVANHSRFMKEIGNGLTGSKSGGWKLTAPGLKAAANLIRELVK